MVEPLEYYKLVYRIAGEAAGLLRDLACRSEYTRSVKGDTIRADLEAESYIIDALKGEGIGGKVVTEERGVVSLGGEGPTFILDPLDGSTNYKMCIPWCSVSLAVAPPGATSIREVIAGVVVPVFEGTPLGFIKGRGCFKGFSAIEARSESRGVIFVYIDHPEAAPILLGILGRIRELVGGKLRVRSLGSAALEMSYTALGEALAFIDIRSILRNVDVAAALGILRECGGEAYTLDGRPLDIGITRIEYTGPIVASREPEVALKIAEWAREVSSAGP